MALTSRGWRSSRKRATHREGFSRIPNAQAKPPAPAPQLQHFAEHGGIQPAGILPRDHYGFLWHRQVSGGLRSEPARERTIEPAGNSATASRCASGKFWMATLEKTHARPPLIYAITGTGGELSVSLLGCRAVRTIPVTAERGLRLQCAAPTDSSRRLG